MIQNYEKLIEYGIKLMKPIVTVLACFAVAVEIEEMINPIEEKDKEYKIY